MSLFGHQVESASRDQWTEVFAQTLRKLKSATQLPALSSLVQIEVAKEIAWLAKHGPDELKELASEIIATLPDTSETRLNLALTNAWMRIEMSDPVKSEETRQTLLNSLADELLSTASPHALLRMIEHKLHEIDSAGLADRAAPVLLIRHLLSRSADFAKIMVEQAMAEPKARVVAFCGEALAAFLGHCHEQALSSAERLWSSGELALRQSVARLFAAEL